MSPGHGHSRHCPRNPELSIHLWLAAQPSEMCKYYTMNTKHIYYVLQNTSASL